MTHRHPSRRRGRLDLQRMTERVAEQLRAAGVLHPGAAAATRALRGASGHDLEVFAAEVGLSAAGLRAVELGEVPVSRLPPRLLDLGDVVDWSAVAARDREPPHPGGPIGVAD